MLAAVVVTSALLQIEKPATSSNPSGGHATHKSEATKRRLRRGRNRGPEAKLPLRVLKSIQRLGEEHSGRHSRRGSATRRTQRRLRSGRHSGSIYSSGFCIISINQVLVSTQESSMPHKTRPMTALLVFTGLNAVLCATITPVYDFVCFLPYWERRRDRRRQEREAAMANSSK